MTIKNKRILLGITGGIAAYKCAFLLRLLKKQGADVRCVMTESAKAFITPLTCQALSGHPVRSELFDCAAEHGMGHIELAKWADLIVIAPASANCLAKLAHGLADDLLTTLYLATKAPVFIAPAMNQAMWSHPATQANISLLTERHVRWVSPVEGEQACGDEGVGCMASPEAIISAIQMSGDLNPEEPMSPRLNHSGVLHGVSVLISAGPTQEAIDPVRYISNRSSGKMGFALAEALAREGAKVTLVAGPVHRNTPKGVERLDVVSADEMAETIFNLAQEVDVYIGAAAVADYTVKHSKAHKIKKAAFTQELTLFPTVDIIQTLAQRYPHLFLVGFAAETQKIAAYAKAKLKNKSLDLVVANQVGDDLGFEQDENEVCIYSRAGASFSFGPMLKIDLAEHIAEVVANHYAEKAEATS